MGDPKEQRVCDHTHTDQGDDVTQILRIAGEPVGSRGNESVLQPRRIHHTKSDDSPDCQKPSKQCHWNTDDETEIALEYPRIPVQEQQGCVDPNDQKETDPGQRVLPGKPIRRRPDPSTRNRNRPDCSRQHNQEDGHVDGKEGVGEVRHSEQILYRTVNGEKALDLRLGLEFPRLAIPLSGVLAGNFDPVVIVLPASMGSR